jgi:hypothetical protein
MRAVRSELKSPPGGPEKRHPPGAKGTQQMVGRRRFERDRIEQAKRMRAAQPGAPKPHPPPPPRPPPN